MKVISPSDFLHNFVVVGLLFQSDSSSIVCHFQTVNGSAHYHSFPFDNKTKYFRLCLSYEVRETLEFERPDRDLSRARHEKVGLSALDKILPDRHTDIVTP